VKTVVECIVVGIEGIHGDEWMDKATTFLNRAFSLSKIVRCSCSRCQNMRCLEEKTTIVIHLCKNGFVRGQDNHCHTLV
jgi:hypothetical protein